MPSTALMGFSVPTTGTLAGTWGDVLNEQVMGYLDQNFAGINTFSLSSSNVLLTSSQARNQMFRCTGVLLSSVVISPDTAVLWNGIRCVENVTTGSFTVTLTNSAGSVIIPQGRRAVVFIDATNGPRIIAIAGSGTADPIPTGTVMLFYQNAAPSGWTISAALNDYAMKIVSSAGGVTSGSVLYSTLFGRTATDSHVLTIPEMPAHTHPVNRGGNETSVQAGGIKVATDASDTTGSTGGGGGHTHNIDMRVFTASMILATRN